MRALFFAALAAVLIAGGGCRDDAPAPRPAHPKKLIILGIDGMDPGLLRQYMAAGKAPNLERLAARGSFHDLQTSNPPQSPVAWSHFITGHGSGGHGIYDFVHRDPRHLSPYLSTSKAEGPPRTIELGDFVLPLGSGGVELLREGEAFWETLEGKGVPATVFKVPANFPPKEHWTSETLSGMGTPDVMGTYGTFQVFSDDPAWVEQRPSGGRVTALDFGGGQTATAHLAGPPDPFAKPGSELTADLELTVDRDRKVARVVLGGEAILLAEGEWSAWRPARFSPLPVVADVAAIVRFYLKAAGPHVTLYASPVNIDPADPLMPISSPRSYAAEIAADAGPFYTQGMPEDTKALAADVLDDDAFLQQEDLIFEERQRLLRRELDRFTGGVLFFYFSSVDQVSHVFFRALDPDASPEDARYAHVIPDIYARADAVVGEVLERAGDDTDVIVMSDHGFAPYKRKVHLNTWLADHGYLQVRDDGTVGEGPLGHIDWSRTQAYALGLNQLFLNLRGREAHGVVDPDEAELLLRRLDRELRAMRDPDTGGRPIRRTFRPDETAFADRVPDLIVGYNRGYRSSDESAVGELTDAVIEENRDKWSGDHCIDPALVPGVLLSTRPVAIEDPALTDLAPTILDYFGVPIPAAMTGRPLL